MVAAFGARFLARGNAVVAREQGVKERTVVAEYASLEKAIAAYDSPAYAEAFKALGDGAVRDSRIIEELGWDYHLTRNATAPCQIQIAPGGCGLASIGVLPAASSECPF